MTLYRLSIFPLRGLMTYGEGFILLDPEDPNPADTELSSSVAPHELAHAWFGDLVRENLIQNIHV